LTIKSIKDFLKLESSAGIILFAAALLAIIIDNSPYHTYYEEFFETILSINIGSISLSNHLLHWINDGLMVIFFLTVGSEIKREIMEGELNSLSKVILPGAAALGGMIVPAVVFSIFNWGNAYAMRGWAIPTATDIAFSLGILSLLGSRVPLSLKVFLAALAIFDDLGAIVVIAIFYTAELSWIALVLALVCLIALTLINRMGVVRYSPYLIVGVLLWLCVLNSGVHATLAGVALAFALPLRDRKNPQSDFSPSKHLVHVLHPWVAFLILPIFAFANAGVSFSDVPPGLANIFSPVTLGVALGLLLGKLIGVFGTTFLAVKSGLAKMPSNSSWVQVFGIALVCGVGFTMSFFVGSLAYEADSPEPYAAWLRLGVIFGSLSAGILGYIVLRLSGKKI
jgi:NhaA family Na+:H+ antiporter